MENYIFAFLLITTIVAIVGITSYFEEKVKAGGSVSKAQFQELSEKLDTALSRIETLERLATDEDQSLKREFRNIKKSA